MAPDGTCIDWPGCGSRYDWPIWFASSVFIFLVLNPLSSLWSGQSFVTSYAIKDPIFGDSKADLVYTVFFRRARNPKDKSYELYAIPERMSPERPPLPDYERPISAIYKDIASDKATVCCNRFEVTSKCIQSNIWS